jgi:hypothetical protein
MTITTTKIFNGNTSASELTVSSQFSNASFIYLIFPDSSDEIAIDSYLQVELDSNTFRLIPVVKYEIDSESIVVIPEELKNTDIKMRLVLNASSSDFVEIYVVTNIDSCENDNNDIKTKLSTILLAATSIYQLASIVFGLPPIPGLIQLIPTLIGVGNNPSLPPGVTPPINIPAIPAIVPLPILTGN